MRFIHRHIPAALALAALVPVYGLAQDTGLAHESKANALAVFASADTSTRIGSTELDAYRGGADTVSNSALSNGTVNDTTAVNVNTGWNTITDGAFAHASGLPIVIQNSGANVLIQNSTIVNVQFK